jgi:hypothetical protein
MSTISTFNTVINPVSLVNVNQVLEPSEVAGVMKLKFSTLYFRKDQWKDCLSEIEEACAVSWIITKSNKYGETATSTRSRKLFVELRKCHRHGSYASVANCRPIQKKTKKCNCKAQLKIECLATNPLVFVLTFCGDHVGHTPGDRMTDLRTLPLARKRLAEIRARLTASPSMPSRQLRIEMLREMDRYNRLGERKINYFDIYNITAQVIYV